jgi:hypothetical protein
MKLGRFCILFYLIIYFAFLGFFISFLLALFPFAM